MNNNISLDFNKFNSNRQKKFNFSERLHNFSEYRCKIPVKLDNNFQKYYLDWFKNTSKSRSVVLVEKDSDGHFMVSTSSNNNGFHKYMIHGIINYMNDNNKTPTNKNNYSSSSNGSSNASSSGSNYASSSGSSYASSARSNNNGINRPPPRHKTNKKIFTFSGDPPIEDLSEEERYEKTYVREETPIVFERDVEDKYQDAIYNWLEKGVDYDVIITFLNKLKKLNPKAQFLTIKDNKGMPFSFNFDMLKNEEEILTKKINGFMDKLYNYDEENDIYEPKEFKLVYGIYKDGYNLVRKTSELREKVNFKENNFIWKDYLISIGICGINIIYELGCLDSFVDEIELFINNKLYNIDENKINKERQYCIRKLYRLCVSEYSPDFKNIKNIDLYLSVLISSRDKSDEYLIKRGIFCDSARDLIEKDKANEFENGLAKLTRFKINNKRFFRQTQIDDNNSGYYAEEILKRIS